MVLFKNFQFRLVKKWNSPAAIAPTTSTAANFICKYLFLKNIELHTRTAIRLAASEHLNALKQKFHLFSCRTSSMGTLANMSFDNLIGQFTARLKSSPNYVRFRNFKMSFSNVYKSVQAKLRLMNRRKVMSLSATGTLFQWDDFKITNQDVKNEVNEILAMFKSTSDNDPAAGSVGKIDFEKSRSLQAEEEWKMIYDKPDLIIWRRQIKLTDENASSTGNDAPANYDLYEYKVLGRFFDVTPIEFFQTQIDLDYRKEWDYLVLFLNLLDTNGETSTELIHWVMRFPYPLYPREYIFVRRFCMNPRDNMLMLVSRAIPECSVDNDVKQKRRNSSSHQHQHQHHHHQVKTNDHDSVRVDDHHNTYHNQSAHESVRVTKFKSNILVVPHSELNKPGFTYVIQYYDINKAKIPKFAYKWMAASGLPDFIDKLHRATRKLKYKYEKNNTNQLDLLHSINKLDLNEEQTAIGEPILETKKITDTEQITGQQRSSTTDQTSVDVSQLSTTNSDQINQQFTSNELNEFYKLYLESYIQELIVEFFDQHEPHPVFFS